MHYLRLRGGLAALLVTAAVRISGAAAGRLEILPERLELHGGGERHGVLVTLVREDGARRDVTRTASFSVAEAGAQTVKTDLRGLCEGLNDGEAEVTVSAEGLTAAVPVRVSGAGLRESPSFKQDVLPVLTKTGCNTGGCHGKLAGQNGFRLSLRGYAPEWDQEWITQELNGRRVDFAFPEESLLLRKPCGELAHEGGVRFRRGSREWRLLADWIGARAPGPDTAEADAERLEVLPGGRSLEPGESQQLLVRARYPGGRVRDVTWLAFFSNDENTVSVKPDGLAKALRAGEGSVRVHFQGLVEVVGFSIPFPRRVSPEVYTARGTAVDEPLFNKLRALNLPPSGPCDDAAFLRRIFLDVTGLPPGAEEAREFLADSRPDKRARLTEQLLERPEFTDFWTLQLADLLQNRRERDHDVRGAKGVRAFHGWLRSQVAANRPWNEIARSVLLSGGDVTASPQAGYFITVMGEHRKVEESELPDSVAQSFLGTRIGCARCHNHPLERYTQDDFYHFAACFSKVNLDRQKPETGSTALTTVSPEEKERLSQVKKAEARRAEAERKAQAAGAGEQAARELAECGKDLERAQRELAETRARPPGVTQPRTGKFMPPRTLDRTELMAGPGGDPRVSFVDWMLGTEQFSGAMVNRVWKHFMGTGLVEPVDDLRVSNPPSNAEMWAVLNREFSAHGFDLKHLIRLIVQSRAYQLESATLPENETDTRFYSHFYARRLPAETLLDAVSQVTGVPDRFPGYPVGMRAQQIADTAVNSYFLSLFGRSDRVTACACERRGEVTLPQMLHIRNSGELEARIKNPAGRLAGLLKNPDDRAVIGELFLSTVSRPPAEAESARILAMLKDAPRDAVFADLLWALLNSSEFAFNH
ncbi:MAG: DUF1549 domain-containing protein [Verrucomicrobiaceae bacterium]|nr:MAG: DUF1549 domain-containing protein [Verrucomicrobiaceae bacterium]